MIERALRGQRYLTRTELGQRHRAGLGMAGQGLAHLVMHAELEGVIWRAAARAPVTEE